MESISPEIILRLREIFKTMEASRIRLRPILADIAASIDKGFFIDADSEEVNILLKQILDAQEKFSTVEQTKRAATLGKLEQVDKVLANLEQNSKREEILQTLSRIATITLDSQDPKMIESLRKLKLQAEYLKGRAAKIEIEALISQSEKFILLDEIIANSDINSTEKYLEAAPHFNDNPILMMALSQNRLHFPGQVEVVEEVAPPEKVEEKPDKKTSLVPNIYSINAVNVKYKKIKPPPDLSLVLYSEESFKIEKSGTKKNFSVKSFHNKLHELLDSSDPVPIFRILLETRIFFKEDAANIKAGGKFTKRLAIFIPTILERLFTWGIVDKVSWREHQFYFLNNFGYELCTRAFRNIRISTPNIDEEDFPAMIRAIKYASMKFLEPRIKDGCKISFEYNPNIPFARAERKVEGGATQVLLMISLNLLGENWIEGIAKFRLLIEREINESTEVKAVFVITFDIKDLSWIKMFDMVKFKGINFFMCTPQGLYSSNGKDIDFKEWMAICKFGRPSLKDIKQALAESLEDEDEEEPLTLDVKSEEIISDVEVDAQIEPSDTAEVENFVEEVADEEDAETEIEQTEEPPQIPQPAEVELPEIEQTFFIDSEEKISDEEKKVEPVAQVEVNQENELAKVDTVTGITNLFKIGAKSRAMLSLHALKDFIEQTEPDAENWAAYLADEIGFILDDPLTVHAARHINPFTFWTTAVEIPKANVGKTFDYLNLAAMIKGFFAPPDPTSYQLQKSWKQLNEDKSNAALKSYPAAKNLISLFNNFTEKTHRAFADCLVGASNLSEDTFQDALAQIKMAENIADSVLHSDVNHRRVKDVINQIFSTNGQVRKYLNVDAYGTDEILEFCRRFEATDLTALLAENSAQIDKNIFSEKEIGEFLDHIWNNPQVQLVRKEREPFKGPKRRRVTEVMTQCLVALTNYLYAKKTLDNSSRSGKPAAPVDKALENLSELKKQISRADKKLNLGQIVFRLFVENLEKKLSGENITLTYRECVLTSAYIELENDFPTTTSFGVEEFSLKNRVMNFEAEMKTQTFDAALKSAYETSLRNYDCGILQHLIKFYMQSLNVTEEEIKRKLGALDKQVDRQIDRVYNEFLSDLELARNYSRITDQEKIEFYISAAVEARKHFMQTKNAGLFQNFIDACNKSIVKSSMPQKNALNNRLKKLEESLEKNLGADETLESRYPILANIHRQIELMNLTVAEDYMNRLETEGGNLLTELDVTGYDLTTLDNFIRDYETLFRAISNANGSVEGAFKQRLHGGRVNRENQNAIDFLHGWQ
ncbi:MAG: hypothetical protein IJS81_06420, partial [Selenomonadaceae bacterium]|nr:hypothetical protein [Selenomonadaceae bacterium]